MEDCGGGGLGSLVVLEKYVAQITSKDTYPYDPNHIHATGWTNVTIFFLMFPRQANLSIGGAG